MEIGEAPPFRSESNRSKPVFVLLTLLSAWVFATVILLSTQGVLYPGFLMLTVLPVTFAFILYRDVRKIADDHRDDVAMLEISSRVGLGHQRIHRA